MLNFFLFNQFYYPSIKSKFVFLRIHNLPIFETIILINMTTFKVTIPEIEISTFKEYLNKIGAQFEEFSSELELSNDYKKMMDSMLYELENGKLNMLAEEEFKYMTKQK